MIFLKKIRVELYAARKKTNLLYGFCYGLKSYSIQNTACDA